MTESQRLREAYESAQRAAASAERASDRASEASNNAFAAWVSSLTDEEHEATLRTQMTCQFVSSEHVKAVLRLLDKLRAEKQAAFDEGYVCGGNNAGH